MRFHPRLLSAVLMPLLLAGCSGEPGEADMERAMSQLISDSLAQTQQALSVLGPRRSVAVGRFEGFTEFEKTGCTALDQGQGYKCGFRYTATLNGHTDTASATGRFYQTPQGWTVEMTE